MPEPTRDPNAALGLLTGVRRVLITSHAAPDGDALGSELGLAELLRSLAVDAVVCNRDPSPASLAFLPGIEDIQVRSCLPEGWPDGFDLVVVLECPGLDRPGLEELDRRPILNIDHHLGNELYGKVNYVDEEAPAVGEMIMRMAVAAGVAITGTMATSLYTALVTDTGDFRYSNATPRAFEAAGLLVSAGARPDSIADALWQHVPIRVLRLTAEVLTTLELLAAGRVAVITCDLAALQRAGARREDTENLINYPRSIDGVEVAVLFKTLDRDREEVRVSLRSRGAVDVQAVASHFGGGGHRNAAGCTIPGRLAQAREALLAALLPVVAAP